MNIPLKNYVCRYCGEEQLSFTVKSTNQVGIVELQVKCSNCSESYPTVKSQNREPHTESHKEEIEKRLNLKES